MGLEDGKGFEDEPKQPIEKPTEHKNVSEALLNPKDKEQTKLDTTEETLKLKGNMELSIFIRKKFGNLKFSEGLGEGMDSIELFTNFISSLPDSAKEKFQEKLKLIPIEKFNEEFIKNGFPINIETYKSFNLRFNSIKEDFLEKKEKGIEIDEKNKEVDDKNKEVNDKNKNKDILVSQEKVDKIKSIWGDVKGKDGFQEFESIFSRIENLEEIRGDNLDKIDKEVSAFVKELSGEKLKRFLNLLKETDKKDGKDSKMEGSLYKSVCGKLGNLDSGFAEEIRNYERSENVKDNLNPEKPSLKEFQIKGFFQKDGEIPQKEGDFLKSGDQLLDLGEDPPKGYIGDKNFKLETEMPVGEYYPATVEFEKVRQVEGPIFEKLGALKDVLEKLDPNLNEEALPGLKEQIKNILPYSLLSELGGVDNINSIEDLKDFKTEVWERYEDAKDKLEKAKKKYEEDLADKLEDYRKNTEAKNEKVREVYKFLKSIGFDLLSQDITDKLIEELNINSTLRSSLGFNSKIDLKNGNLGFDNVLNLKNLGAQEKSTFAKFFNKIISGSFDEPVNIIKFLKQIFFKIVSL